MDGGTFSQAVQVFLADQDGVTAIEYALLAALIFAVIVASVTVTGQSAATLYDYLAAQVAGVAGAMP